MIILRVSFNLLNRSGHFLSEWLIFLQQFLLKLHCASLLKIFDGLICLIYPVAKGLLLDAILVQQLHIDIFWGHVPLVWFLLGNDFSLGWLWQNLVHSFFLLLSHRCQCESFNILAHVHILSWDYTQKHMYSWRHFEEKLTLWIYICSDDSIVIIDIDVIGLR